MNVVFGLNVIAWGVLGLWFSDPVARWSVVRVCISCLHFTAGVLFLVRRPLKKNGSVKDLTMAIPSLIVCGFAFRGAYPIDTWSWIAEAIFMSGTAFACTSLLFLGRSFAVLPAVRDIVSRGPYRWVRHPVYLGELLLVLACAIAAPNFLTVTATILSVPMIAIRILAEEHTLKRSPNYQAYQRQVRWRFVPFVW